MGQTSLAFERTLDFSLVRQIITHPRIWPHVSDDFSPAPEDFVPKQDEAIWYVLVKNGDELLGLFSLFPQNAICWELHTCLLPNAWKRWTVPAARGLFGWIFSNTGCLRIVTSVPEYNRVAVRAAVLAGMMQFGVNEKSWMRRRELQDQILLGVSKGD
jgi:RimJ/RimL family protein N-acetyltransferase